ncbi:MAG: MBL fold metallo-hydrolase [Bacilli bacterium]
MVKVFNFEHSIKEFSANTYVVGKIGNSCLVIDLGSTDTAIYDYIETHYSSCAGILLTHAHFDHIRGLPTFLKHFHTDIPVYLNSADWPLLTDPNLNSGFLTGEKVKANINPIDIKDNQELSLSNYKVKVIATPFHTMGSVCYLFDDDNALFTGDSLFKGGIGRTDMPTSDPNAVNESLRKLLKLRDTLVVYPGHGSLTRLGEEKKTNSFLMDL